MNTRITRAVPTLLVVMAFGLGHVSNSTARETAPNLAGGPAVITAETATRAIEAAPYALVPQAVPGPYGKYGSGTLGDYRSMSRALSTDAQFLAADVWQFGDSIARADGNDLAARMHDKGIRLAVDNWASRATTPTVDSAIAAIDTYGAPDVIVMAIGTNDIFDPPVMRREIDRFMAATPPTTEVVWVNVYATRWSMGWGQRESDLRNTGWVNDQIMEASHKYPNFTVAKWYELLSNNPGHRLTNWLRDGVHTTTIGQAARNQLIVATVEQVS